MCDENSAVFKRLFADAHVCYDRYVRTTDPDHKVAVEAFWSQLKPQIKIGTHTGFYSTNEETFMMEKDLIKQEEGGAGKLKTAAGEICEEVTESNYVFEVGER